MNDEELQKKEEILKTIAQKIQDSNLKFPDIREREWLKLNSKASQLLKLLIEAENIMIDLDTYQMENNQCYPEIEDMMLQLGVIREKYSKFVDDNPEVLDLK